MQIKYIIKLSKWSFVVLILVQGCGEEDKLHQRYIPTGGPVPVSEELQAETKPNDGVPIPSLPTPAPTQEPETIPDIEPPAEKPSPKVFKFTEPPEAPSYARDIQRGAMLNAKALYKVLDVLGSTSCESDLKQLIHQEFAVGGSIGFSFNSIVASGSNALTLHYNGESRCLSDGEMIKIDIGSKLSAYSSDITRSFPANGVFTDRQREVYSLVLEAQKAVVRYIQPGRHSLADAHAFVREYFRNSPLRARDSNGYERTMDHFFIHSLGHYIGKNVHGNDLGYSHFDPLRPGRVIAIEPGLYLPREGLGIRIEDDFLITESAVKSLNPNLIVEIQDIEDYMARELVLDERIVSQSLMAK